MVRKIKVQKPKRRAEREWGRGNIGRYNGEYFPEVMEPVQRFKKSNKSQVRLEKETHSDTYHSECEAYQRQRQDLQSN